MNPISIVDNYLKILEYTLRSSDIPTNVFKIAQEISKTFNSGNKVILAGNGGSAATCSHIVCDLSKGTKSFDHTPVINLSDNPNILTAYANDVNYDDAYAEMLKRIGNKNDLLIILSGSGQSMNLANALIQAHKQELSSISITGKCYNDSGGLCAKLSDISIVISSRDMQIVEDIHLSIFHMIYKILSVERPI